jgi:hypothetical protein
VASQPGNQLRMACPVGDVQRGLAVPGRDPVQVRAAAPARPRATALSGRPARPVGGPPATGRNQPRRPAVGRPQSRRPGLRCRHRRPAERPGPRRRRCLPPSAAGFPNATIPRPARWDRHRPRAARGPPRDRWGSGRASRWRCAAACASPPCLDDPGRRKLGPLAEQSVQRFEITAADRRKQRAGDRVAAFECHHRSLPMPLRHALGAGRSPSWRQRGRAPSSSLTLRRDRRWASWAYPSNPAAALASRSLVLMTVPPELTGRGGLAPQAASGPNSR